MVEKIIEILSEIKNDNSLKDTLDGNTDIINDVGLDSLQMINFILKLEDEFNIEIDFDKFELADLQSIDGVCNAIKEVMSK